MKIHIYLLLLILYTPAAFAAEPPSTNLLGTYSIKFEPLQSGGGLIGCSLIYNVILQDHVYHRGSFMMASGNISYMAREGFHGLMFKLGTTDILSQQPVPHSFAYLQTKNVNLSKEVLKADDSDKAGFRIYILPLSPKSAELLTEMLESQTVSVGFSRNGGLDEMFHIDLGVKSSAPNGAVIERVYSKEMMNNFMNCVGKLLPEIDS